MMNNEFEIQLVNIQNKGFGFKVVKSDTLKGGLAIKEIYRDSPASSSNLKIGDHIIKVNKKPVKRSRNKIIDEINDSKCDHLLLLINRDIKESRHQSFMNLSLSSFMSNPITTIRNSKSSIDLNYNTVPKQILDSNFVPEDTINNFIEDCNETPNYPSQNCRNRAPSLFTLEMSIDDCREDSDSPQNSQKQPLNQSSSPLPLSGVQITRKQAYKKGIEETDNIMQSSLPKYNIKRATNSITVSQRDPVYTVKKKTSVYSGDGTFQTSRYNFPISNPKGRASVMNSASKSVLLSDINYSNSSINNKSPNSSPVGFQISQSSTHDHEDGNVNISAHGKKNSIQLKNALFQQTTEIVNIPLQKEIPLEIKLLSFKEKISKPLWKQYLLEDVPSGVVFKTYKYTGEISSLNSTALDPSFVGPELMMTNWDVNNTSSVFYLPIGQLSYDSDILRSVNADEIRITNNYLKVDFIINLSKVASQNYLDLFKILKMEVPEPKLPVIKHKKSVTNLDHIRLEPKKTKQPKALENLFLNSLHKTNKVEGVPLVIIICVTIIEELGQIEEGIYRKNGNMGIKKFLEDCISNEHPTKWSSHEEWTNVHTIANLLKGILRKYILFDKDIAIKLSIIKIGNDEPSMGDTDRKLQEIMDMIYHLYTHFKSHDTDENRCRLDTFKYLIKHLYRMSLYQSHTKMSAENLATCFVPNLIEDIPPSEEDNEYKTSKRIVVHENLSKMVTFWIMYADLVCELLEEEKEEEINKKVLKFLTKTYVSYDFNTLTLKNNNDKDILQLVRERIEFFTEGVIELGNNSHNDSLTNVNTSDSYFSRTKNSRLYQSVKQPKKTNQRRRNSSASRLEAIDGVKVLDEKPPTKLNLSSPSMNKKTESWSMKSVRKKKDMTIGEVPGIELRSLIISGDKKDVPLVVVICVTIIEKFGMLIDGIYRISGRNQDITNLDILIMTNELVKWDHECNIKIWSNMHNTACLLKKVLKKFCLIPKETWMHMSSQFSEKMEPQDVKNVLKAAAYHLRIEQSKCSSHGKIDCDDSKYDSKQIESYYRSGTLRYVLLHLKHIATHVISNRMNSTALAVCFVPVLMEEDYSTDNMMVINTKCVQIVQLLIDHCEWIFQWDGKPSEDLYGLTMSDSLDTYLNDFKPGVCQDKHNNEANLVAEYNDIEYLLKRLISTGFCIDEMPPSSLKTYINHKHLSSSLISKSNDP